MKDIIIFTFLSFSLSLNYMKPDSDANQEPPVSLEVDYMEDKMNETLSDIHVESTNQLEINQIVAQSFGMFFKKPH